MAGFIFGAPNLPKTQQELDSLRKITQALAVREQPAPKNIGEGLTAIGNALAYRSMLNDLNAGSAELASKQSSLWPQIGAMFGATPAAAPAPSSPNDTAGAALSPAPLSQAPQPMSGGALPQNSAALTDAVAKLESGNSPVNGPAAGYANYRFQQFPAFAKQYGSGEDGVANYARQVLAANPNATFGDMYGGYVTGTGNPAVAREASLQTTTQPGAKGAYANLVQNSPVDPKTPLSQLLTSDIGGLLGPASAYADTPKAGDTLLQQPPNAQIASLLAGAGQNQASPNQQIVQALSGFTPGATPNVTNVPTRSVDLPANVGAHDAVTRALMGQTQAQPYPASQAAPQAMDPRRQRAIQAMQFLQQHPELSDTQKTVIGEVIKQGMADDKKTNDVLNYEYSLSHPGFKDFQNGANSKFGLNPVYGTDSQGNPVIVQLGSDGKPNLVKLPNGVTVSTGVEKVDLGTQWGMLDKRSGQIVGYMPKDLRGAESEKAIGKVQGAAQASLPKDIQQAEQTVQQIDQLMSNKGLDSIVGPLDQFRPSWTLGSEGRDALARYNQLKGKAFLSAYSMLKGGGQITEIEGTKAENAMARMDRAQSEDDFKRALSDFRDAVQQGVQKLREVAGQGVAGPAHAVPAPSLPQGWSVKVH